MYAFLALFCFTHVCERDSWDSGAACRHEHHYVVGRFTDH
jgi:hypothetical protein